MSQCETRHQLLVAKEQLLNRLESSTKNRKGAPPESLRMRRELMRLEKRLAQLELAQRHKS